MAGLVMKVMAAGRAALVNAENTGTAPRQVKWIGVTETPFVADEALTALPGQLKVLASIAGQTVADDTIHVTLQDASADAYSMYGFGLILDDGTLLAAYGQSAEDGEILGKSSQASLLMSLDVRFVDVDATSISFGDSSFSNPPASETVLGVVKLASPAAVAAGEESQSAVTPAGFLAAINARFGLGAPSAFVKSLLALASAAMIRAALEIKSAATKDMGSGNGLDADLLDGQHGAYYCAWGNFTGVPASFTPSAHSHPAGDITSGTLATARGGTGLSSFTAGAYFYASSSGAMGQRTPAQVLADIGAAAASHVHSAGDITSGTLATARGGTGLSSFTAGAYFYASSSGAMGQRTPAQVRSDIGAAESSHTHSISSVSGLQDALDAKATPAYVQAAITAALANYLPKNNPTFTGTMTGPAYNKP